MRIAAIIALIVVFVGAGLYVSRQGSKTPGTSTTPQPTGNLQTSPLPTGTQAQFTFADPKLAQETLSGTFNSGDLDPFLLALEQILPVQFKCPVLWAEIVYGAAVFFCDLP